MLERLDVIALSGGKDSTALALALHEAADREYVAVCTPTGDELPEMEMHWQRLGEMLGKPIIRIEYPGGLRAVTRAQKMLPNFRARFCTRILKIETYRAWMEKQAEQYKAVHSYVGLRYDEPGRAGGNFDDIEGVSTHFPMREWQWGLREVWKFLDDRSIKIPRRTDCARCYHQQLGEWYLLWKEYPEIYADAINDEVELSHTYRTPGRDTWPTPLSELAQAFKTRGAPVKSLKMAERRMENREQCRVCSI
jgi:3'-phosphoadenosine 5'-phosphosulfate sulfotransferase (PAPS reductase)/FAD synthetase